jgi:hypothetical protein
LLLRNRRFNTLATIFSGRSASLAERDGSLWSAAARGRVVRISPGGKQQIITQRRSGHFQGVTSEASRYLEGTLPNGLAFARNGDILISNFGTDCLEPISRDGATMVLADSSMDDRRDFGMKIAREREELC